MRDVRSTYLRYDTESYSFCEEGRSLPGQKEASFLTETPVGAEMIKSAIDATGYSCLSVESNPYEKKGLFGWK